MFQWIPRLVISRVLGHTEGENITAIYDRASYDQEKRDALIAWGERVERILHPVQDAGTAAGAA